MPTDVFGGTAVAPGTLMLFAQNLMEKGGVAVSSSQGVFAPSRLYDGERGPVWMAGDNSAQDIVLDLEVFPRAFSHVALVNIGVNTGLEIYSGATSTGALRFSTPTIMGGDPYIASLGGLFNDRFVRVRILGGGVVPTLGELVVCAPRIVARPPFVRNAGVGTIGNVVRDRARGGHLWSAKLGPARARLPYGWTGLTRAELDELEAAFAEAEQGAKNLVLRDSLGVARWVSWLSDALAPVPVGGDLYELPDVAFEEAL